MTIRGSEYIRGSECIRGELLTTAELDAVARCHERLRRRGLSLSEEASALCVRMLCAELHTLVELRPAQEVFESGEPGLASHIRTRVRNPPGTTGQTYRPQLAGRETHRIGSSARARSIPRRPHRPEPTHLTWGRREDFSRRLFMVYGKMRRTTLRAARFTTLHSLPMKFCGFYHLQECFCAARF